MPGKIRSLCSSSALHREWLSRARDIVRHGWLALGLLALTSCAPAPDQVELETLPVVGGTTAAECAWPSTVQLQAATGCTATLIHPRIVTTAAHCLNSGGGTAKITFTGGKSGSFTVTATKCKAGAVGESGVSTASDWGYCVLPEDSRVQSMPIMPPLMGCEADRYLKANGTAWIVGFGATSSSGAGFGTKRQVEVVINNPNRPTGVINVGDAQKGACHGDSGGPLYLRVVDGAHDYGWRVAGSTSGPGEMSCDCNCSSTYVNIKAHVAAIEKNEGIDVTPCTDSSGAWAPGPDCKDMQQDPANATGTYPNCVVSRTTEAIQSCGSNTGGAGGTNSTGGTTGSTGGTTSTGGSTGGATSTGGVGGRSTGRTGGATSTGGRSSTGGTTSTGGTAGSMGGATSMGGDGGVNGTGGSAGARGGAGGSGGDAGILADAETRADARGSDSETAGRGGSSGMGGTTAAGGTNGTGGSTVAGGSGGVAGNAVASGGSATGGAVGSGGVASSGGASSSGGSSGGTSSVLGSGGRRSDAGAGGKGASSQNNSGCSCNLSAPPGRVPWQIVFAALAVVALRRRHRRQPCAPRASDGSA